MIEYRLLTMASGQQEYFPRKQNNPLIKEVYQILRKWDENWPTGDQSWPQVGIFNPDLIRTFRKHVRNYQKAQKEIPITEMEVLVLFLKRGQELCKAYAKRHTIVPSKKQKNKKKKVKCALGIPSFGKKPVIFDPQFPVLDTLSSGRSGVDHIDIAGTSRQQHGPNPGERLSCFSGVSGPLLYVWNNGTFSTQSRWTNGSCYAGMFVFSSYTRSVCNSTTTSTDTTVAETFESVANTSEQ